jgi:hypothetical protein
MLEPSSDQIETRWHRIVDGIAMPHVPEIPHLGFMKVDRLRRSIAQMIYEEVLAELRADSRQDRDNDRPGMIDELDIPRLLGEWAGERGQIIEAAEAAYREYVKKITVKCPFDFTRASTKRFTDEELAAMDDETRGKYNLEEFERTKKQLAWVDENTTPEEAATRDFYYALMAKRRELEAYSAQPCARAYRDAALMAMTMFDYTTGAYILSAMIDTKPGKDRTYRIKVRAAVEEWDALDISPETASLVARKWKEWEVGGDRDFLFP